MSVPQPDGATFRCYVSRVLTQRRIASALALSALVSLPVAAQVTTAQYDNGRTGAYLAERILTPRNVNRGQFGKLRVILVDGDVYAQVLHLPGLIIPGRGRPDIILVATEHNSVYAIDTTTSEPPRQAQR